MEPRMCKGSRELHGDKKGCCCLIKLHGRSRMSGPLRVISDNERRRGQESSTWPVNERSKANSAMLNVFAHYSKPKKSSAKWWIEPIMVDEKLINQSASSATLNRIGGGRPLTNVRPHTVI